MRVIYPDFFSGFFSRSSNLSITISGPGFFYGHDQMVSFHFVLVFQRWFISSKGQNVLFSEDIECHFKLTTDILEYSLLNLCDPLRYNAGISSWCLSAIFLNVAITSDDESNCWHYIAWSFLWNAWILYYYCNIDHWR